MVLQIMFKVFNCARNKRAFSLVELMVVFAIIAIGATVAIPLYTKSIRKANVAKMVNKLGTFKLALTDTYSATGTWPAALNGATSPATVSDSFFDNATDFRYKFSANKVWFGYKLSADYGTGWIFLVIIANDDDSFDVHCGSLNSTCTLGSCNSAEYFPNACSESGLNASYTLE